jgi:hypothetical protein
LSDVGAGSDASQLLSPSIQTVDEENSHTGAYGSESTASENLQSVESAVDDDDNADDVDIKSIMTSVQEQSEPLPMPELDLDESLTGEAGHAPPAEGKKRHWGIHFSLGKKKEMK